MKRSKNRSGEKVKLTTFDELLGASDNQDIMDVEIKEIHSFKNHPFKVIDDEKMQELVESIAQYGVLTPILIRPDSLCGYEAISGHRRIYAAKQVGLAKIPAVIKELTDDEATIMMVDANIQREELLPSERAFAYKMKLDAMYHQGQKIDSTFGHRVPKWSHEELGQEVGLSGRQVQRYIRLTYLIPELLDMTDTKQLPLRIAVDISYFDAEKQNWLYEYMKSNGVVKENQIAVLKQKMEDSNINKDQMIELLNGNQIKKSGKKKITFSEKKLAQYFPPQYTVEEMEDVIDILLQKWKQENNF